MRRFLASALLLLLCLCFFSCDREIDNDYRYDGGLPSYGDGEDDDRNGETTDFPYLPAT